MGLAGAAQIARIDQKVEFMRSGQVIKTTQQSRYIVTSLYSQQAGPEALLAVVRGYWAIEIKQHYRRDHTQREDHCQVRHSRAARNLCLMRSIGIFLYELQRNHPEAKKSLPDWSRKNHRNPNPLIGKLMPESS